MACNMAAFKFCCVTGCVYESDDFNRVDSTSLGAKWTETAGDWSIDTNRLKIVATADAIVECTTTHPTASTKYIVSVSVTLGTNGDVARVFVDDGAYFAEVERITSTCGRLRLYDGVTCRGSCNVSLGGYTRLVVCSEGDKVHVGTGGSPMLTVPASVATSVVQLGTGACTGTVYFEDFSLSKHSEDDATCPACGDEGCTWFADSGCTSGSLSATDWTTTGTWRYYSGGFFAAIECTADGSATVVPTTPFSPRGRFGMSIASFAPGDTSSILRLYYDSDTTTYIESGYGTIRVYSGGVQYGPTMVYSSSLSGASFEWCFDGTTLKAGITTSSINWIAVPHVPTACAPSISVSGLTGGAYRRMTAFGGKVSADVAACPTCATSNCTNCAPGTFPSTAQVVIANITSVDYGCTCTDVTIPLTATTSGCQWTGSVVGPCSTGLWTATATVTAVTGGYKLTVSLTVFVALTATFENTVLSGSPVDCMTVFDGDVPRVGSSGSFHCDLSTATCTFTAPAP